MAGFCVKVSAPPGTLPVATKPSSHTGQSELNHAQMCTAMIVFLMSFGSVQKTLKLILILLDHRSISLFL